MSTAQRRALVLIAVAQLLALTLWFSASAVGPQLQSEWGLSQAQTGTLTLAVQLGFVVGALGAAMLGLADVIPARTLLVGSAIAGALVNGGFASLGRDQWTLAVSLRFLTGLFLAGVYPAGLKVMAGWFTQRRGMALGVLVGALTIGSAGPHLIRGLGLEWRAVVLTASALALVAAIIMAFGVVDGPYEVPTARFSWRHINDAIRLPGYRLSTVGYWGHMWELYAMWTWTAVFLSESSAQANVAYPSIPVLTFSIVAIGGLGAAVAGRWADRFGRTNVAGGSLVVSGACAAITPLVFGASIALVFPLFLVWGFAVVADSAQFSTMATETTPAEIRGTALALQTATGFLLTLVTIRGVPWIADQLGWQWAFPILAVGPAIGLVAMIRLRSSPASAALAGGRG